MIEWIKPKTAGRRSDVETSDYAFATATNKSGNKGVVGVITVGEKAMKALGWVAGDKIQAAQQGDFVYMRRVIDEGFSLSPAANKKKGQKSQRGQSIKCSIKSSDFKFGSFKKTDAYSFVDGVVTINTKAQS